MVELNLSDGDLCRMLSVLDEKYPGFQDLILKSSREELKPMVTILRNGTNILHLDGLGTTVINEDLIVFFPPTGGG